MGLALDSMEPGQLRVNPEGQIDKRDMGIFHWFVEWKCWGWGKKRGGGYWP